MDEKRGLAERLGQARPRRRVWEIWLDGEAGYGKEKPSFFLNFYLKVFLTIEWLCVYVSARIHACAHKSVHLWQPGDNC